MRKAKRGGGDLTGSSRKNRRASSCKSRIACKNEGISGLLVDSDQDVWAVRLKSCLSKSVASVTFLNGDKILFSCSGIAMERQGGYLTSFTSFLTTASFVSYLDATNRYTDLKIQVRPEGTEVYEGFLANWDLFHNFAVVDVHTFLDVQVGPFQCALESLPQGKVLAVGRCVSGEIMVKSVELDGHSRVFVEDEDGDLNCKVSEPWEGGLLLSVDEKMVGMNLFLTMRRAVFLPWGTILKHLERYLSKSLKKSLKVYSLGVRPIGEKSNSHPEVHEDFLNQEQLDLDSMGYPKLPSTMLRAGMILVNNFEDTFGDICGKGVWRKFSKRASSNVNRNVVALASFNGEKRFFACTGFFIEWNGSTIILTSASLVRNSGDENKIVENLRIAVLVNNQRREGTLQHCNLHYNVALVSVNDYRALRPANTLLDSNSSFEVAAVGRCFKSGALMATRGFVQVMWSGTLDCKFLVRSTCKITKAGIGGPLVNLDGDVVGMNFYDTRIGTPFLFMANIHKILASFETESGLGEVGNASGAYFWKLPRDKKNKLNRWPVPMPRWCLPEEVKCDEDNESDFDRETGELKYTYIMGDRLMLL